VFRRHKLLEKNTTQRVEIFLSNLPDLLSPLRTRSYLCSKEANIDHTGFLHKINRGSYEDSIGKMVLNWQTKPNNSIENHSKTYSLSAL